MRHFMRFDFIVATVLAAFTAAAIAAGSALNDEFTVSAFNSTKIRFAPDGYRGRFVRDRWFVEFDSEPGSARTQRLQQLFNVMAQNIGASVHVANQFSIWPGIIVTASNPTVRSQHQHQQHQQHQHQHQHQHQQQQHRTNRRVMTEMQFNFSDDSNSLPHDILKLTSLSIVKAVYPVAIYDLPDDDTLYEDSSAPGQTGPENFSVHNMTSVNLVHSQLGLTGAGVRVGVIDDGVDYTHPALGGCFGGPSCRIQYGYDLVGNNFDPDSEDPAKKPSPQPTPYTTCGSHGTHTTGIVGGTHMTNGFSGVAPGVALGVYRVFGCGASPQTDAEVIVMAMQAAYRDGMNVINLSIGGGSAWPEYPTAAAGSYLSSRGTIVVGSAGNDGPMGAWDIGAPGVGRQVLGVSSYENTMYRMQHSIRLSSNPARFVGHADPADKRRKITTWNNVPIVPLVDSSGSNLACGNITMNLSGAVGIVARGTCMFTTKAKNLAMAPGGSGALGLIIYNNEPGPLFMAFKDDNFTFPVIGVTEDEGKYLLEQINQATATTGYPPRITETDTPVFYDNPGGDTVSSFSSYGPGPWLDFKPDLGAPGGLIFSTLPNATYGIKSGTSMAAPYIAGSVALVMQSMGTDRPFEFYASCLVTTAVQKQKFNYTPSAIETAARQGGGLVNVYDAITNRIHVEPSRISFNDTGPFRDFNKPRVVRVYNWHDTAVSFAVNHVTAQSMASYYPNGTFAAKPLFSSALGATATILATPLIFTVSPGGFADVSLFAVPPTDLNPAQWWIYSGYIRLTPTAVTANKPYSTKSTLATLNPIHVPYIGMKGNYRAMPIFDFDVAGKYPSLLSVKTKKPPLPSPVAPFLPVFTMVDRDLVAVGVRNLHPTRQLNVRVLDAATNTSLGFIEDGYQKWYGRNDHSPGNAVTWFVWKGGVIQGVDRPDGPDNLFGAKSVNTTAEARPVPDGTYRLKVEALRPFGDLSNPDEYETWVSNPFVVARTVPY